MFTLGRAITAFGIILEVIGIYCVFKKYPSFSEKLDRLRRWQFYTAIYAQEEYTKEKQEFKTETGLILGGLLAQLIALLVP